MTAVPPSVADPRLTRAIPAKPTAMPARCGPRGTGRRRAAPNSPANNGVAPLSRPVTAELMCSSASGNSVNGIGDPDHREGDHPTPVGAVDAATGAGITARAAAPSPTRAHVIRPGWKSSSPMAMNRNDEPQITPTATNRPQSSKANGSRSDRGTTRRGRA